MPPAFFYEGTHDSSGHPAELGERVAFDWRFGDCRRMGYSRVRPSIGLAEPMPTSSGT